MFKDLDVVPLEVERQMWIILIFNHNPTHEFSMNPIICRL